MQKIYGYIKVRSIDKNLGRPKAKFPDGWEEIFKEWKPNRITAVKALEIFSLKKYTL